MTVLLSTPGVVLRTVGLVEEMVLDTPGVTLQVPPVLPDAYTIDWSEALVLKMPRQVETLILEDT